MLAVLCLLAQPVLAGDLLRYGGDRDFAPFESLDAQGRPQGFQIALLKELAQAGGFEVSIHLDAWNDVEAAFKAGKLDVIAMVDTRERRQWAEFARGHATPAFAIYHLATQAPLQSLQDIAGQRIAMLDGPAMHETRETFLAGVRGVFVPAANARDALAAVQGRQADVALLPRAYGDAVLASGALHGVVASSFSPVLQTYGFAVAPGNTALRERLEAALLQLEQAGRLEALRVQWLSNHRDAAARDTLESGIAQQRIMLSAVAGGAVIAIALLLLAVRRRSAAVGFERQRRAQTEAALRQAEERLAGAFTRHPEPMLITDLGSGAVQDVNDALCHLVGMSAQDLLGQPLDALAGVVDAEALQRLRGTLGAEGGIDAAPVQLRRMDGTLRSCLVSSELIDAGGATHVFSIVRDMTEQLERDAAMRGDYETLVASLVEARAARAAADERRARAEDALQGFTAAVSHDLKAPLLAFRGFAGLLRSNLQAGRIQEAVANTEQIDRAAQRMEGMVSALTRLARVEQTPLRRRHVDMTAVARGTWALIVAANPARRVSFMLDDLPGADADAGLVVQIWQNLLDNAFKFCALVPDPKVRIDSFRDVQGTWYRATDNGPGLDMANAERLFQPFQRMHPASQFTGTGVGLSIVRRIVQYHGGEVRVRSSLGVGTVVEFRLEAPPGSGAQNTP